MDFTKFFRNWIKNTAEYKNLQAENSQLHHMQGFMPGHFYSPVVDISTLIHREAEIWGYEHDDIAGIDFRLNEQLALIRQFSAYYPDLPYLSSKRLKHRYYFDNDYYTHNDAITLYSMIRLLQPVNIIEIGSGFSSAVMLDTNEFCCGGVMKLCFIDPYPERLNSLLNDEDKTNARVIADNVQAVPLALYKELEAGDILFVDSSHVLKTGSDLNHILFTILPVLKAGVHIHFHDIFYPFEYPREWVIGGRNWNENYALRAFLMYNQQFRINIFSDLLYKKHKEVYKALPLAYNVRGSSLWIEKIS